MKLFIDTSAFLAVLDADDHNHRAAKRAWTTSLEAGHHLFTSSFVLCETLALTQYRMGLEAVRAFHEDIFPLLNVIWIDQLSFNIAMQALLTANRKKISLVDCTSFSIMREHHIPQVLAFDRHFSEQGFQVIG